MIYKIIAIVILLVVSAFFSASETALFSLDTLKIRKLKKRGRNTKNITTLLKNPIKLLTTILIGNELINITASGISASIFINLFGNAGIAVSIGVMTFLLLLFCEFTPKRISIEKSVDISVFCSRILIYISRLFLPIQLAINKIVKKFVPEAAVKPTLSEDELRTIIDIGHKEGVVSGHEKDLIGAVLGFTDTVVSTVMVKREKIKAISIDSTQEDVLKHAKEYKHSKIPVYKTSLDNILGVLYSKELFLYPEKRFTEIIKPVLSVPHTQKIKDVLRIFEDQNIKISAVVDEKGTTCGLITMEDIIEEVFGEIYDEFEILSQVTEEAKGIVK